VEQGRTGVFPNMRCNSIFLAICLALSTSLVQAETCTSPAFAVNGLQLDTTAVDGTLARKKALSQATADAFAIIKRRLLLPTQPAADQLDELAFADFIDFIHIESETALAQRYIAEIDICFDPVRLRDQFIKSGLLWSELFSSPVLLLPVWQDPSGIRVWTRNVAWLDVWRQMDAQDDQLLRFTILTPDLALERRLPPERIRNYDSSILALSAAAAGAQQIAVLFAGLEYTGDVPKLIMKADLFDVDGKFLSEISAVETDMNGRTNMPEAFSYFREDFITTLSGIWQQKNLYTLEDRADIHVELPVSNLQSWYRLRTLLSELPIVQSLSVVKLTSSSGLLKLSLSGSVEALQMAVRSIGYRLEVAGAVYQLKLDTS
tara:strand:+ start:375 stop:1502 length:1128 start_codon:yes stop_codon:yes gene_type:complete